MSDVANHLPQGLHHHHGQAEMRGHSHRNEHAEGVPPGVIPQRGNRLVVEVGEVQPGLHL
jgi:hypothetical protein